MPSDRRNQSPSPPTHRDDTSRHPDGRERHPRSRSPRRLPSRSQSPAQGHRYRSRSPKPRSPPVAEESQPKKKKIASGFKFKEKPRDGEQSEKERDQPTKGLERGYREKLNESRPQPLAHSDDSIRNKFGAGASVQDKFGDVKVAEKFGAPATGESPAEQGKKEKKKKETSKSSTAQPTMEMIVVFVNDRLGTRAQIMCSPSDTIKDFKAFTAQKIGRKPHEIMVKRQGERPFRDQLTLEDYGVGNGVQLDLELDTGD